MPKSNIKKQFTFYKPGNYRIRVQGFLDESWSERMSGMSITTDDSGDDTPVTTLDGLMRDQAELAGVLNTIYELHLPLLSVKYLDDN
jgi:hypothetical protein